MPLRARSTRWPRWLAPLTVAVLLLPAAGVALAAPPGRSASSASLAGIASQIAVAKANVAGWDAKAETASERFNAGRVALVAAQRLADQRQAAATASAHRVAAMQGRVRAFAAASYINGGTADTTLGAEVGDPGAFLDRQVLTERIGQNQAAALAVMRAAQNDAITTARAAQQAWAARRAVLAALQADRRAVASAQTQALRTVVSLQAQQARLVRLAQIAEAKAAAAAAAARSAQERAAALRARIAAHRAALAAQAAATALSEQATARQLALAQQPADTAPAAPAAAPTAVDASPPVPPAPPAPASTSPPAPALPSALTPTATVGSGTGGSGGDAAAGTAVSWARQELGKPYQWAAAGPDTFDCSGLTLFVYAKAGIYLGHYTGSQFNVGRHVSRGDLIPGDLVFFGSPIHHVGIYVGGGQMIHAPQTGDVVRFASVDSPDYAGAVRVVG